jgi:hypothetical protein
MRGRAIETVNVRNKEGEAQRSDTLSESGCGGVDRYNPAFRSSMENLAISLAVDLAQRHQRSPHILEIGGGAGELAVNLIEAGSRVTMCDLEDNLNMAARELCVTPKMRFIKKPAQFLSSSDVSDRIDMGVALRSLHWPRYEDAKKILSLMAERMPPEAPLVVSIAGLGSAMAEYYPFREETPVEQRYAKVRKRGKPNFNHEATLYTGAEATGLLKESGFRIRSVSMTTSGMYNFYAARNG